MLKKYREIIFDDLLQAISDAILIVDKYQKIEIVNSSMEKIFGFKTDELMNIPIRMIIRKEDRSVFNTHFDSFIDDAKKELSKKIDLYAESKTGDVFPVEVGFNLSKVNDEKHVIIIINKRSIESDQKSTVSESNFTLENRIKGYAKDFSSTIEELEKKNKKITESESEAKKALKREKELNELKTKFLSMVSHEFKTPLTGISISTMLIEKYKLETQQNQREKHLSIINGKVNYLNKIVDDFLSIEKIEKGQIKYDLTFFRVRKLIDEVIEESKLLLKEGQKIIYNVDDIDEILLHQDRKIIELTLTNLLSNAIKYSRENKTITIDIQQNETKTIIKVIDKGFGIPKKDQKNIFKRYFRAENVLLIGGTGIGLNIVKNHLNNLGGSIEFVSKVNSGTTFTVIIPNKVN